MSRSSRINKSTAVGALAACAVIGATSPVWADSGTNGASDPAQAVTASDTAVISALRAQVAKLTSELQADNVALRDATRAAQDEARALAAAKAEIARLKAANTSNPNATPSVSTVPAAVVPAAATTVGPAAVPAYPGHPCRHNGNGPGDPGHFRGHGYGGSWRGR